MTAGELAARFDCSWPTTTRHLSVLADAGLIRVTKVGRERHYVIAADFLTDVAGGWITRFENFGTRVD